MPGSHGHNKLSQISQPDNKHQADIYIADIAIEWIIYMGDLMISDNNHWLVVLYNHLEKYDGVRQWEG
jgi:hypothetical protein